jgi:hypothetical protein
LRCAEGSSTLINDERFAINPDVVADGFATVSIFVDRFYLGVTGYMTSAHPMRPDVLSSSKL